ncbi:unnamed protein product [Soboliphyme baturini]|uniref:Peptidase_M13_N domain-containing protein n=1 Tax=Soboliphyme baturini TaxID=241478 RepID=A0A183JA28_9BILA|nr:unnamed protein product [Soboliphyme baturini]
MNISTDPCDDFYDFMCGAMESSDSLDDLTLFEKMQQKIDRNIIEFLESIDTASQIPAIEMTAKFYRSCVNHSMNKESRRNLIGIINELGGWPMLNSSVATTFATDEIFRRFARILRLEGIPIMINPVITVDWKNTTRCMVNIFPAFPVDIPDARNSSNDTSEQRLSNVMNNVISMLAEEEGIPLDDKQLEADIEDVITFERQLGDGVATDEETSRFSDYYNLYDIEQAEKEWPELNLRTYFQELLPDDQDIVSSVVN